MNKVIHTTKIVLTIVILTILTGEREVYVLCRTVSLLIIVAVAQPILKCYTRTSMKFFK